MDLYPTLEFLKAGDLLIEFTNLRNTIIEVGLAVEGPAAAYAEVWEWGNARQTKEGPRTVRGVNPNGESVWLSSQAPRGYIRVNDSIYLDIIKVELGKLEFKGTDALSVKQDIERTCIDIMQQIAHVVEEHAPVDTGQLSQSFRVVRPNDPLLQGDPAGSMESRFNRVLYLGGNE